MRARERRKSHRGLVIAGRGRPACPVEDKAGVRGTNGRVRERARARLEWDDDVWDGTVVPAKVDTGGRQLAPDGQKLAGPAATARGTFLFFLSFFLSFLFRRRRRSSFWAAPASRSLISNANARSSRFLTRYFCECARWKMRDSFTSI